MSSFFRFVITTVLVNFFTVLQGQTLLQDCKVITMHAGWTVCAPNGFICKGDYSIDSYMGTISSEKDNIKLHFDILSVPLNPNYQNQDCSLEAMTKMANSILNSDLPKKLLEVPDINRMYIDTINGRIATIVVPQNIGRGRTFIHIIDCPTNSTLFIDATDLNPEQQKLVLEMFQTIKYFKKDEIITNTDFRERLTTERLW